MVKFNYDGDFFLSAGKDGEVCLIRTETSERVGTYQCAGEKMSSIYAVDITMDSQYVVTAAADGRLIWFHFDGRHITTSNHGGILKYVEWNQKPGHQNFVVTCNDTHKSATLGQIPNRIMVWQFEPLKKMLTIDSALPMKANKVKWGPFDETLIATFDEGQIIIYDSTNGSLLHKLEAHKSTVTNINFTEDRMMMISCSKDMTAKLWTLDDYECIKTYKTDRPLNDAAISPLYQVKDEKTPAKRHILLAGGQDEKEVTTTTSASGKFEAQLWHMVYGEELGSIKGHFGPIHTIAWRRDGKGFVTGGEDGLIRSQLFDAHYFTSPKFE